MKFLKKLALDIDAPSDANYFSLFSASARIETFLSTCLRSANNLVNHAHKLIVNDGRHNDLLSTLNLFLYKKNFCSFEKNISDAVFVRSRINPAADWIPLIKETTHINDCSTCIQSPIDCDGKHNLAGRSVLCVGGRIVLYPAYRHVVEAACGNLLIFHGGSGENVNELFPLLESADMVICPVDCVNHEAYFAVKYYCNYSGKPCALLDRSRLATFRKGIESLVSMVVSARN